MVAAAWLHDTVEDTGVTMEMLKQEFGEDVAALVAGNSEDKMEEKPAESTWEARKAQTIRDLRFCRDRRVKLVVFADKLANLRSLCRDYTELGDKLWERFNQKDPGKHRFYYGSVMLNCTEFVGTKAFREYRELMDKTFGKYDPVNFMEDCTVLNIPMSVKNKPRPEDAELLVDIGYAFEHGTCFVENRDTARQFYSLAIERGSKTALNNMGHVLMNDPLATEADIQTAVRCLKSAVNAGIPQAMVNLGTLYQNGAPGLEPDAEKAFKLFRKAGRLGDDDGLFYYAFCLEFGIGTKQNREKAFPIFLDLYERGHSPAYIFVGLSYLYSWGTDTDYFKARGIFRMGAMAGDAGSYAQLGQMYEAGLGCSKDPHAAADCYLMAGALGDASGYTNYARLLEDGDLGEPDPENAALFYRKAADTGDKQAMEALEHLEKEEIE